MASCTWGTTSGSAVFVNTRDLGNNNQKALEEIMHMFFLFVFVVFLLLLFSAGSPQAEVSTERLKLITPAIKTNNTKQVSGT